MSRAINVSAAEPRYFQWPFYQRQAQAQWPFDQGRNNGLPDRPLEFSNKLQFRYYPAQSIYQRSGQAIFNKSRPNDRCISARSNGRFYHRQAQWPFYQSRSNRTARPPDFRNKLQFRYYPAQSIYQRPGQAIFKQNPAQWPFYQRQVQWPFYQHQAQWPVLSSTSNRMARPADLSRKLQFRYYPAQSIYQRPGSHFQAKAGQWPFYQRQVQWPFYQRQAQWPFYQGRSDRTARKQASRFQQQLAISLLSRRINVSAAGPSYFRKSRPMDVLSTPGPMAVLTTGG